MSKDTNLDDVPLVQALLEHPVEQTKQQQDLESEWHDRAAKLTSPNLKAIEPHLAELDAHLTLRSYIVGYTLSRADLWVWGALRSNKVVNSYLKQGLMVNLSRWFNYIEESEPWIAEAVLTQQASKLSVKDSDKFTKEDDGASYDIGLQDVAKGVVTRFPPEPSGYLHIGHAKAAILNDYFAHVKYPGNTLILRFDDTNPLKEKQEFEDSIIEDLALMGVTPDKTSHTSDYFQHLHDMCLQILRDGNAYADDTDQETMRAQRMDGIPSARRDTPVSENLTRFAEMLTGSPKGKRYCIRAKVSIDDPNKAMRDPVIYRVNADQPHHRTGSTWKAYPTYDFACPLIDAYEGVTHALRTTEYKDRDAQYQWFIRTLKLRDVFNWDFARLNLVRTLLSKRKLTSFVETGRVSGWDDPRMPTIRGIRRRGMTVPALREYILKQGPSRNIVNLDWTVFWATNKKFIDPVACRYTAVVKEKAVPVTVTGARGGVVTEEKDKSPNHARQPLGMKKVVYSKDVLVDQADAVGFEEGEEITMMNWGNAIVRSISHSMNPFNRKEVTGVELELHLQGDVKSTKKKVTWLSKDQDLVDVELVDYDFLITKDKIEEGEDVDDFLNPVTETKTEVLGDCNVAGLREDEVVQIDRKGYYRADRPFLHGQPAVLFQIPTGKTK